MKLFKVLLLALLPTASLADVSYTKETNTLRVSGPTDMVQVLKASQLMDKHDVYYIELWGPGGYLKMGLQLGNRISKETTATVVVPKGKKCTSACALAALGSSHIRIDGELLFHRPFIQAAPILEPLESIFAYVGKAYLMTAYYLEDHGYPRSLMQNIMTYTSPCKFIVFEDKVVTKPEELILWKLDNSRCEALKKRAAR